MSRRGRGVAGLSLAASAGLLGTYVGYPGLRKAHAATTCQVTSTGDDKTAPYTSGELRYCLHQVHAALADEITFADSTNGTPIKLKDHLPKVNVTSSVTVTGNGEDNTIIDGVYAQDSAAGFYFTGTGNVTLTGLTIRNTSTIDSNRSKKYGAAVFSYAGEVIVESSTFEGNGADFAGAIYAKDGNVSVTDSTFDSNTAIAGGAIAINGGDLEVTGSTFTDNKAEGGGEENLNAGGAISISNGALSVSDSTFANNTAGDDGGAIFTYGANDAVEVSSSTFTGNTATDGDGGAIKSSQSSVTVARSTFASNDAGYNGGAIYGYTSGSVVNSTFTGNSADEGAAVSVGNAAGSATLNFVTVSGNNTTSGGPSGAVDSAGDATVTNSIVYGNTGDDVYVVNDGTLSVSHSLFSSSSSVSPAVSGSSLIFGEDPLLGSLADNGGPTQTMLPAAESPVIGTANPVGPPATDQRGFTRTTDGLADMGAVQVGGVAPEPDLSQVPPSWLQAQGREESEAVCPPGMAPSWAQWPNEGTGGWTCEYTTWWDVNEGVGGGWVTTPGFRAGRIPGL